MHNPRYVRFQVLKAASMMMRAFRDIVSYSLVGVDQRFREAYCFFYHQGDESSRLHGVIAP
jgi:hypothetical protein